LTACLRDLACSYTEKVGSFETRVWCMTCHVEFCLYMFVGSKTFNLIRFVWAKRVPRRSEFLEEASSPKRVLEGEFTNASSTNLVLQSEFSKVSSLNQVHQGEFLKARSPKRILQSEFSKVISPKRVLQSEFSKASSPTKQEFSKYIYYLSHQNKILVDQPYAGPAASCCGIIGIHSILGLYAFMILNNNKL
jgi:hypothetical protein